MNCYATYLRPYAPGQGLLGPRTGGLQQVRQPQDPPGDTSGIAAVPGGPATRLAMSWGSAVGGNKKSEIYAAVVTLPAGR